MNHYHEHIWDIGREPYAISGQQQQLLSIYPRSADWKGKKKGNAQKEHWKALEYRNVRSEKDSIHVCAWLHSHNSVFSIWYNKYRAQMLILARTGRTAAYAVFSNILRILNYIYTHGHRKRKVRSGKWKMENGEWSVQCVYMDYGKRYTFSSHPLLKEHSMATLTKYCTI